jgi:hypothetical protein
MFFLYNLLLFLYRDFKSTPLFYKIKIKRHDDAWHDHEFPFHRGGDAHPSLVNLLCRFDSCCPEVKRSQGDSILRPPPENHTCWAFRLKAGLNWSKPDAGGLIRTPCPVQAWFFSHPRPRTWAIQLGLELIWNGSFKSVSMEAVC